MFEVKIPFTDEEGQQKLFVVDTTMSFMSYVKLHHKVTNKVEKHYSVPAPFE